MGTAPGNLEGRVAALVLALDEVLEAPRTRPRPCPARPRRRAAKAPRQFSPSLHTSLVITALADVVLASPPGASLRSMSLTWYQLKARTRLNDDLLGRAVCALIPQGLCTRHDGIERVYFLPSKHRASLLAKSRSERLGAAKVAA